MTRFNPDADPSCIRSSSDGAARLSKQRFRFGRFELDVHARELLKDGVRRRLQDQPFVVLTVLLEEPGEVFTREEICSRLWPHGTFVDFEDGLNAAIKRLRNALGDIADDPRFVESVHRRGRARVASLLLQHSHGPRRRCREDVGEQHRGRPS